MHHKLKGSKIITTGLVHPSKKPKLWLINLYFDTKKRSVSAPPLLINCGACPIKYKV